MPTSVRAITTRLAVDGEREFKKAMSEVNTTMRTLKSELELVDAQFKGQANTMEALRKKQEILKAQYDQQRESVKALEKAVKDSTEAHVKQGGSVDALDKRTLDLTRQLNRAKVAEIEMNDALEENAKYLKEAEESADGCAKSIDGYGKAVKEAADETGTLPGPLGDIQNALKGLRNEDGSFNLSNLTGALSTVKGALVGGAIVTGAKEVIDAIFEIVNSTEEYRESMGKLEVAFDRSGYSADQAAEAYKAFYEITGDTTASVSAANNLATLGLEWDELKIAIDAVSGAAVLFGDSVPIDSLAESIADTVTLGKVTGNLADVLNRTGYNEDEFNKLLEATGSHYQRISIIMSALVSGGLLEANDGFRDSADSVIAMRDAQLELNAAMAELGELLSPLASDLVQFGADVAGVAADIIEKIEYLVTKAQEAKQAIDELAERNAAVGVAKESLGWLRDISLEGMISQIPFLNIPYNFYKGAKWLSGSHAAGLDRVPYDGYIAELHANEAVLNAQEAALWRSAARYSASGAPAASTPAPSPATAQSAERRENVTIDVTLELDGQTLARKQYPLMQAEGRRRGTPLAGKEGT